MKQRQSRVIVQVQRKKKSRSVRATKRDKEVTLLGKAFRGLGAFGGSAIGGMFGSPVAGGAIGRQLGASLSKWLGSGDYAVRNNTIVKSTQGIPSMHATSEGVVLRHREYIGVVKGATTFTVRNNFALNPGLASTFPWLSGIAQKFQEYRVLGAVYHYIPSSGAAVSSTNPALGTVMMSTQYRATATAPTDRLTMLNQYWSSESVPSEPFIHPLECEKFTSPTDVLFTRTVNVPTSDNLMMYDFGITTLAVDGQQANDKVLGDLWLTYEVELLKPQINSNVDIDGKYALATNAAPSGFTTLFAGMNTSAYPLLVTGANNTITFPVGVTGSFEIVTRLSGSGLAPTASYSWALTNCSGSPLFVSGVTTTSAGDANFQVAMTAINVIDPTIPVSIALNLTGTTGTLSAVDLMITQRSSSRV